MMRALILVILALPALAVDTRDAGWNQWRGPNRDGISPDTGLLKEWPAGGPPLAWKATGIGEGYSSVSISGDKLFTQGDVGGASSLLCLKAADGKIVWTAKVGEPGGSRDAGTRGTPATDGTLVFALGQAGELVCVEAESGKVKWQKSLQKDFGGRRPGWWWSESPLLDGDLVVCTPGGSKGTVVALKKETGETAWQSADFKDGAHYTSLLPAEIGGVRQYIVLTADSVAGIGAKDGKLLWRADRKGKTAVIPTPIYKDGILFVVSGYGIGCNAFKITADAGIFKIEEAYSGKQVTNHHGGVVLVGDHLYELDDAKKLKCVEFKTGKVVWEDRCVGKGSIAYADGHLYCRGETSEKGGACSIALVEASPAGYKEKGRIEQPDRSATAAWAHPVVFDGRMYIRDMDVLLCYDVKAK
jgi:outer membrane protein assembly factor BamB